MAANYNVRYHNNYTLNRTEQLTGAALTNLSVTIDFSGPVRQASLLVEYSRVHD